MTVEERAVRADLRFPRACRLGRNRNYRYVYRKGKSYPSHSLVVIYLRAKDLKLGFPYPPKWATPLCATACAAVCARTRACCVRA